MGVEREEEKEPSGSSVWDRWTPVLYKFPWGISLTRGCFFAWFFLTFPYIFFRYASAKGSHAVFAMCGRPQRDSCAFCLASYTAFIPTIICAIIWVIVTIILFLPWLLCYLLGVLLDFILLFIYGITCRFHCCTDPDEKAKKAQWRIIRCSGWANDWSTGYDPYTHNIWTEWSPVRTLCDYNFPPV